MYNGQSHLYCIYLYGKIHQNPYKGLTRHVRRQRSCTNNTTYSNKRPPWQHEVLLHMELLITCSSYFFFTLLIQYQNDSFSDIKRCYINHFSSQNQLAIKIDFIFHENDYRFTRNTCSYFSLLYFAMAVWWKILFPLLQFVLKSDKSL